MAINISNILAQLNTKMSSDSSASTTELLRRVKAYQSLSNIKGVHEVQSYGDLPAVDSSNIGQLFYVRSSLDDSFGTFFFSKAFTNDSGYYNALDSTNSGWQKIVLTAGDSDNFPDIVSTAAASYAYQGSVSGYMTGGAVTPPYTTQNIIDKYSFVSDGNATDVGDLTSGRENPSGQSSSTHGYASGGYTGSSQTDNIEKFSFTIDGNSTDVANLTVARNAAAGASSADNGYAAGGQPPVTNVIDKFPFAADENATDVGDLTTARRSGSGQSSTTHGYMAAGTLGPGSNSNVIDKYSFSADGNATDVGDTLATINEASGQSSTTHGYVSGSGSETNVIQKFPFSSDANSADVGDLTVSRGGSVGTSSDASGYAAGGKTAPGVTERTEIDKFSFSSDGNATDVGDLTVARYNGGMTGQQV